MAIPKPQLAGKRLDDDALSRIARMRAAKPTVDDSLSVQPTTEGRARAEADRLEAARRATAERDARQQPGNALPPENKGTPAKPAKAEGEDDLGYLARLRAMQDRERQAQAGEREASKAQQVQAVRARAGAAGLGLSGASAGQEATVVRQADRANAMAEAGLEQRFRDEDFDAIGRAGAIADYEDAYDTDMDGDGLINGREIDPRTGVGDGDPDNDEAPEAVTPTEQRAEAAKKLKEKNDRELDGWDYLMGDADTEKGTKEEPYVFEGNIQGLMNYLRGTGAWPLEQVEVAGLTLFRDKHGNYYYLDRAGDGQGDNQ